LYLALITLMLAGAITVVLATTNFPNGGHGFLGYNGSSVHIPPIRRPSIAASDPGYFRYAVVVAALMFLLVLVHIRGRPGRAWAAIRLERGGGALRRDQHHALQALGVRAGVVRHRRRRRPPGGRRPLPVLDRFPDPGLDHTAAVVLMGGAYRLWGAIVGRTAAPVAAGPAQQLGSVGRLADDPVRNRRAPGADDRSGPGSPTMCPETSPGSGGTCPAASAGRRRPGAAHHDRGHQPDRPVRRRHVA